jgi:hypothetical protein
MQMSRCEDIVQNKEGKLLTNQTTVIVDITTTTTLIRAAEHHKHILEICRLADNIRDDEDNHCGPSNLRLNVQNETLNKVLQNTVLPPGPM